MIVSLEWTGYGSGCPDDFKVSKFLAPTENFGYWSFWDVVIEKDDKRETLDVLFLKEKEVEFIGVKKEEGEDDGSAT